jgi:hypothetical protein
MAGLLDLLTEPVLRDPAPPDMDPALPAASIPIRAPATPRGPLRLRRDWVEIEA